MCVCVCERERGGERERDVGYSGLQREQNCCSGFPIEWILISASVLPSVASQQANLSTLDISNVAIKERTSSFFLFPLNNTEAANS